jgi:uncharacterized protein YdeI (YjbR/CyaY-like superfamily)
MNAKVDAYINKATKWKDEMKAMRKIALDCHLEEDIKWGKPCYSHNGSNIVIIQNFKEYCALLFFKGFALKDPKGILQKTGENTNVGRQVRFDDAKHVAQLASTVSAYIYEAIEAEEKGIKADVPKPGTPDYPEELQHAFKKKPALKRAFEALTPGRQRAYLIHFSGAKQAQTREARIEKCTQQILDGKGMNE